MNDLYTIVKGEAPAIIKNIFRENIHIRNFQIIANENSRVLSLLAFAWSNQD